MRVSLVGDKNHDDCDDDDYDAAHDEDVWKNKLAYQKSVFIVPLLLASIYHEECASNVFHTRSTYFLVQGSAFCERKSTFL